MLTIYTASSSASCRKALAWLDEHKIPYRERNLTQESITLEELRGILMMTETGTNEIISKRCEAYKLLTTSLDDLSLNELYELIKTHPTLLRRPILLDEKRLQIGFNDDDIRRFIPRAIRRLEMIEARMKSGL
ncbi:transcriptional regulator Spx [Pilibacter termitis]|jgi:regulatory protein spx|nr:transcriptional regulator Spx [Pilibacter termitis]